MQTVPKVSQRPLKQKTIGILGGMSNQATAEYYRMINSAVNDSLGNWDIAETLIAGLNFGNVEYYVRNNLWKELEEHLEHKVRQLQAGGADLIICVSNTVHNVLLPIMARVDMPFIHIAEPTAKAIKELGCKKVGILGTKPVMSLGYIKDYYKNNYGIDVIAPNEQAQIEIDRIIFDELVKGKFKAESKEKYLNAVDQLQAQGAEGIILGCTEIFLIINQNDRPKLPFFNTTELHVKAAVDFVINALG
ncbi:MAG: amino acid racemase [Candidatus Caenarcaniphilales bacterium]|jgi:aspartate racemase|nr:amino acid racemase [Candidatus Caenarcaniphilales bacterium]